jgi:hypothetical protein
MNSPPRNARGHIASDADERQRASTRDGLKVPGRPADRSIRPPTEAVLVFLELDGPATKACSVGGSTQWRYFVAVDLRRRGLSHVGHWIDGNPVDPAGHKP